MNNRTLYIHYSIWLNFIRLINMYVDRDNTLTQVTFKFIEPYGAELIRFWSLKIKSLTKLMFSCVKT